MTVLFYHGLFCLSNLLAQTVFKRYIIFRKAIDHVISPVVWLLLMVYIVYQSKLTDTFGKLDAE
jgi:hypothetical protein